MEAHSRQCRNLSEASRHAQKKSSSIGGSGRIRLQASMSLDEPNIMMDDRKEAEKWEHLEELRLWMKHVVGLMSDIINNGLG